MSMKRLETLNPEKKKHEGTWWIGKPQEGFMALAMKDHQYRMSISSEGNRTVAKQDSTSLSAPRAKVESKSLYQEEEASA